MPREGVNEFRLAMLSFGWGRHREGGVSPRKPVTMVAKEAMATVETLKGKDMLGLIAGFLLCVYCFFSF